MGRGGCPEDRGHASCRQRRRNHQRNRSHSGPVGGPSWFLDSRLVWVLGTLATLVLAAIRIVRFSWLLHQAFPAPDEVQEQARELAGRMGIARTPRVWWIEAPLAPMLWAVGCRARLIVPLDLWKSLNDRQRSLLLVHELAHLRRGDHFLRLFELAVTALFWWLPVVWWARLCPERC